MLTEKAGIDKLEVLHEGTVQVREATVIERDGVEVSRAYHRFVIPISDPNPDLSGFDETNRNIIVQARARAGVNT